jgi:hypothetical protein
VKRPADVIKGDIAVPDSYEVEQVHIVHHPLGDDNVERNAPCEMAIAYLAI